MRLLRHADRVYPLPTHPTPLDAAGLELANERARSQLHYTVNVVKTVTLPGTHTTTVVTRDAPTPTAGAGADARIAASPPSPFNSTPGLRRERSHDTMRLQAAAAAGMAPSPALPPGDAFTPVPPAASPPAAEPPLDSDDDAAEAEAEAEAALAKLQAEADAAAAAAAEAKRKVATAAAEAEARAAKLKADAEAEAAERARIAAEEEAAALKAAAAAAVAARWVCSAGEGERGIMSQRMYVTL